MDKQKQYPLRSVGSPGHRLMTPDLSGTNNCSWCEPWPEPDTNLDKVMTTFDYELSALMPQEKVAWVEHNYPELPAEVVEYM